MIDPFVLLTPVLLFGVMALLRFVGCNQVFGINETAPAPSQPGISKITPMFATQGGLGFTLVVKGSNFVVNNSVLRWNGSDRPTEVDSASVLTAEISADDIATAGTAEITVFTSGATPEETSNSVTFTVDSSAVIVHLDNRMSVGPKDDPFDPIPNLSFEPGKWFWKNAGPGTGNSIYIGPSFDGGPNTPHTGSFSFVNTPPTGRRLLRIRVISDQNVDGTISIQDGVNPSVMNYPVPHGSPPMFIETGWGTGNLATTITITSGIGWDLSIDTIVYQGPA